MRVAVFPGQSLASARAEIEDFIAQVALRDPFLATHPPKVVYQGFMAQSYGNLSLPSGRSKQRAPISIRYLYIAKSSLDEVSRAGAGRVHFRIANASLEISFYWFGFLAASRIVVTDGYRRLHSSAGYLAIKCLRLENKELA
jgi:hypothetical protein